LTAAQRVLKMAYLIVILDDPIVFVEMDMAKASIQQPGFTRADFTVRQFTEYGIDDASMGHQQHTLFRKAIVDDLQSCSEPFCEKLIVFLVGIKPVWKCQRTFFIGHSFSVTKMLFRKLFHFDQRQPQGFVDDFSTTPGALQRTRDDQIPISTS